MPAQGIYTEEISASSILERTRGRFRLPARWVNTPSRSLACRRGPEVLAATTERERPCRRVRGRIRQQAAPLPKGSKPSWRARSLLSIGCRRNRRSCMAGLPHTSFHIISTTISALHPSNRAFIKSSRLAAFPVIECRTGSEYSALILKTSCACRYCCLLSAQFFWIAHSLI
jgi:hypothetical protein